VTPHSLPAPSERGVAGPVLAARAAPTHNSGVRTPTAGGLLSTEPRDPVETAALLCKVALAAKAQDPSLLDMRGLVDYCDVFVILTARNRRHVAAMAEELRMYAKNELGMAPVGIEGLPAARWVLVDFGSVIIHLFDQPLRGFYNLDGLWVDAPRLAPPEGDFDAPGASV
jgi:ribosome-associated protein